MRICGIDEAGRGPIAGPVTSSAIILSFDFPIEILNDSKKISPVNREKIAQIIRRRAVAWSVGWAWPEEIKKWNIHGATLLSMKRAIMGLKVIPDLILVDGLFVPAVTIRSKSIVKGDTYVPEIQAASIIAKTERDRWMVRYSRITPEYRFEKHKG